MRTETSTVGGATAAEILAAIRATSELQPVDPATGWRTILQWAAAWAKSPSQTERLLRRGMEAGLIERATLPAATISGAVRPTPVYRYVGKSRK